MLLQRKNLIAYLLAFNLSAIAQTDSAFHKSKWHYPTGITAEYAGGFGMLSAGVLFTPLKKFEVAFTTGYTPPEYGNLWTVNFLFSYSPVSIPLSNRFTISPVNFGAFLNFNFGDNVHLSWPSKYYAGYYWWNSSLRFGPFIEADLKYTIKNNQSLIYFFQCSTNDLYIYSYAPNTRFIDLDDILVLGMGLKYKF